MTTSNTAFPSLSESFEQIVEAAQASGNFKPLWSRFVKTRFYVSIVRHAAESATGFDLWLSHHPDKADKSVQVAEQRDRLQVAGSFEIISLSGADIVKRVPAGAAISLVLNGRTLEVAATRVEWLRKSLQASLEAAQKKQMSVEVQKAQANVSEKNTPSTQDSVSRNAGLAASTHVASASSSRQFQLSEPDLGKAQAAMEIRSSGSAISNVERKSGLSLENQNVTPAAARTTSIPDIAELKPREVLLEALGLEMYVPTKWREVKNKKSLKLTDAETKTIVEVSGLLRDNTSLETWMAQRLPHVTQEMPYLKQMGESYAVSGTSWRGKIQAMATEFRGRFSGDDEDSIYLICCYRTASSVIAICIRAKAQAFEKQRSVFRWLLEKVDLNEPLPEFDNNGATKNFTRSGTVDYESSLDSAPAMFSLSFSGRLGRLRFIVYSFMAILPLMVLMIGMAVAGVESLENKIVLLVMVGVVIFVMQLRPLVLRLHDLNLSGKWILLPCLFPFLAGVLGRPELIIFSSITWIIGFLALWFLPGSSDNNAYGSPCPPNSKAITISAVLLIILTVFGNASYYKAYKAKNAEFSAGSTNLNQSGYGFTPKDQSFSINFPKAPQEDNLTNLGKNSGLSGVQIYSVDSFTHKYVVQRMSFQTIPADKSQVLDRFSDATMQSNGVQLISENKLRVNGVAARELRVKISNGSYQNYRFLFAKADLFMLMVESTPGNENATEIEAFLNSFEAN
ncbi:DUF805 domain-containing protein [Undibacterium amnicola]|uniref:DUF805 domain-containing protein n=1 Tax=Undibacterium amnicola TaxID=1834038 RepID=A0ABR6XN69_9BURK|nr:DUF805 domain-containing protein [Undibacterium amnicola]MBC3830953.1 DUF805 domain-containing protein [Undibacterium amnicola]